MSLDVTLRTKETSPKKHSGIYIRENGMTREISRSEWDERFPDREPVQLTVDVVEDDIVFEANITHNLGKMAAEAGIYHHLWRPEEINISRAEELIQPLETGLKLLQENPKRFKKLSADNGWGTYEQFVPWVERYLNACREYPEAEVSTSR